MKTEIQGQTHVALDNVHMWVILAENQQETDCKAHNFHQWLGNKRCGIRFNTDTRKRLFRGRKNIISIIS